MVSHASSDCPIDEQILRQTDSSSMDADRNEDDHHTNDATNGVAEEPDMVSHAHRSLYSDVRGVGLLRCVEFYQFFLLMGLLTGTGLMTIK